MEDFQEHTTESHPLFIEEKYDEEINHPRPAEEKEQQEEHFISCSEPVSEHPLSEVS
jgi:hypothetical protein